MANGMVTYIHVKNMPLSHGQECVLWGQPCPHSKEVGLQCTTILGYPTNAHIWLDLERQIPYGNTYQGKTCFRGQPHRSSRGGAAPVLPNF